MRRCTNDGYEDDSENNPPTLTDEDIEDLAKISDVVRTRADLTPFFRTANLTALKRKGRK